MKEFSLIGPQVLPGSMMDCGFHYREDVLKKIEHIRSNAVKTSGEFCEMLRGQDREAVMLARGHNNTISILGSRGSGKTSVIMTLQKDLNDNNHLPQMRESDVPPKNIIMPILVPQDIAPGQTLLSWVVSQLLKKAEDIEEELHSDVYGGMPYGVWKQWESSQKNGYRSDPFRKCADELLSAFDLRFQNGSNVQSAPLSDGDQVYYYMDSVKRDAELLINMLKLISMMVDYYRYRIGSKGHQDEEPLLFFTIDDLDLAPDRSSEVLNLILRYLQHPNVVVICGWNHELFQNHLCMDLLKNQDVLESDQLDTNFSFEDVFMERYRKQTTALDSARRLAIDNMKKAFPPAQRFEIRSLSIHERASFPFGLTRHEEDEEISAMSMFDLIEEVIQKYTPMQSNASFLRDGRGQKLLIYMRIFDNKARGLTNTYYGFKDLLKNEAVDSPDITNRIRVLFDIILFSNTRFIPYRRGLRDLVQIKKVVRPSKGKKGELEYYCNFYEVRKTLEKYETDKDKKGDIEAIGSFLFDAEAYIEQKYDYFPEVLIDVFLLLNFMENFLLCITQQGQNIHGGKAFSELLNQIYKPFDFLTRSPNQLTQAITVSGLERLKLFPDTDNFALCISAFNIYEQNGMSTAQYQYTGAHSLIYILKMASQILPENKARSTVQRKEYQKRLSFVVGADPAWFAAVLRLFMALRPRQENVMRLAVYSSMRRSKYVEEDLIRQTALEANSLTDSVFEQWNDREVDLSDEKLDMLVECLRTVDSNRSRFLRCKQQGSIGRSNKINAEDKIAYYRACMFINIYHDWEKQGALTTHSNHTPLFIEDPVQFKDTLEPLSAFKSPESDVNFYEVDALETVSEALQEADQCAQIILHDIRNRMLLAVQANYWRWDSIEDRLQYLTWAADAVRKYVDHWQLRSEEWGVREIRAASELVSIFQSRFLEAQVSDMLALMNLGPTLKQHRREQYNNTLGMLRQWVSSHNEYFMDDEVDRIRENFMILSEAPQRIRRGLVVETDIFETIVEIGKLIAEEFGLLSCKIFSSSGGNPEKRLIVWPVSPSHDKDLWNLEKAFENLILKSDTPKKSLFDMGNSQLGLSLNIAEE